jgi:four helix bundle protein
MTFEDLRSWQEARFLTRDIYAVTREGVIAKDFGVCGQIQRAGVSIMSNIAEGFERQHIPEKLQFYNIARGSTAEVRSLTYVIEDNYPSLAQEAVQLREKSLESGKILTGLIASTESRKTRLGTLLSSIFHLLSPGA